VTAQRRRDIALVAVSILPFVYTLFDTSDGDVPLYHYYATLLWGGAIPYKDWLFEYPPYALVWLATPGLLPDYAAFRAVFSLQILVLDVVAKLALLNEGNRLTSGLPAWSSASLSPSLSASPWSRLTPFLVFSTLGVFQSYFYLKRFDAIAADLTLFALIAFAQGRLATAGALVSFATGTKLYPGLVALVLLCAAWQRGNAKRFAAGAAAALIPIALLSVFAPWWRFVSFHAGRGLQVESTYASIIWLGHFFGVKAVWASHPTWLEVDGAAARAALPVARFLFATVTLGALATSVAAVRRRKKGRSGDVSSAFLARAALLPIVAFIASGIVLSPQFAVWAIGPTAIAATRGRRAPVAAAAIAVVLTTFIFPAPGYFTPEGISLARTLILVARNFTLVALVVLLARELLSECSANPIAKEVA
jgi:hypothetical protein